MDPRPNLGAPNAYRLWRTFLRRSTTGTPETRISQGGGWARADEERVWDRTVSLLPGITIKRTWYRKGTCFFRQRNTRGFVGAQCTRLREIEFGETALQMWTPYVETCQMSETRSRSRNSWLEVMAQHAAVAEQSAIWRWQDWRQCSWGIFNMNLRRETRYGGSSTT